MPLTYEKEAASSRNDECDYVALYLKEIDRTPLLTFEEEMDLSKRIQAGDKEALEHLIKANLRLVVKISRQYLIKGYPLMDIVQDGNIGLITAAEKYDYRHKVRFATYASWWIKQSIARGLSFKKRLIRLPHRKEETLRKVKRTWNQLYQKKRKIPAFDDVAAAMGVEKRVIEEVLLISTPMASFDSSIACEDYPLAYTLEDHSFSPDAIVLHKKLKEEMEKILNGLIPKERSVVEGRFGLLDDRKHTLRMIGDKLGLSAETVRQIELKALQKLRERCAHMADYLD